MGGLEKTGLEYKNAKEVLFDSLQYIQSPPLGVQLSEWSEFNDLLGGFRPGELTLLCAPTGTGKTELLANLSAQFIFKDVPHYVAPVETGDKDFVVRILSTLVGQNLNTGQILPMPEFERLSRRAVGLFENSKCNIAWYDDRVAIELLEKAILWQYDNYGTKVALLDNLNFFLQVTRAQDQIIEMDRAVHALVMLVKKIPIHIVLVVHPKKTEGGRVISEFDIKGSSTAVQEAHNVLLFNRPTEKEVLDGFRNHCDRELIFKKIRKRGFNVNKKTYLTYKNSRLMEIN